MKKSEQYHLIGGAGAGMSGLAQLLLWMGKTVTCSDRDYDAGKRLENIQKLKIAGVHFFPQDGSGLNNDTKLVIVSTAIEKNNPDLQRAIKLNIPVIHRAEMLAQIVNAKNSIAVTGTSGKSTVTGMIGWVLEQAGYDPVVINGAPLISWNTPATIGNVRLPAGGYKNISQQQIWVFEADESDRSLMAFYPSWAVITNASVDHFGEREAVELFNQFAGHAKKGVVSPLYDPQLNEPSNLRILPGTTEFTYHGVTFRVPLMGKHNAQNALLAIAILEKIGLELIDIKNALSTFRGIRRRMEKIGEVCGIHVFDDYAHNPAKIQATISCLKSFYSNIFVVWQPHGFGPLAKMLDELERVLLEICTNKDRIYLLPVYYAGGTVDIRVDSRMAANRLRNAGINASFVATRNELIQQILPEVMSGDAIVVMGARDSSLSDLAYWIVSALAGKTKSF
jgi:UDP-N-acetylmuramate--alanine ligase